MAATVEAEFNPVVDEPFPLHPFANSHFAEEVDRALFQNTGPDPLLNMLTAAILQTTDSIPCK